MKVLIGLFAAVSAAVAALFALGALLLIALAARLLLGVLFALAGDLDREARDTIEAIGLLAVALVGVEIAQTIAEEEVVRAAHISAPTRVRRYLSRFLVVVTVALSIETLVATFMFLHEDPSRLPYAASLGLSAAALLAGWGVFVRLNRSAEELEPEAMQRAKLEDAKLD